MQFTEGQKVRLRPGARSFALDENGFNNGWHRDHPGAEVIVMDPDPDDDGDILVAVDLAEECSVHVHHAFVEALEPGPQFPFPENWERMTSSTRETSQQLVALTDKVAKVEAALAELVATFAAKLSAGR